MSKKWENILQIIQTILASVFGSLECFSPKIYIFGPELNRLLLCWYLLNPSKGHAPPGACALCGLDKKGLGPEFETQVQVFSYIYKGIFQLFHSCWALYRWLEHRSTDLE